MTLHRRINVALMALAAVGCAAIAAMPEDAFLDADTKAARAELRREFAEVRMCIDEYGPGVAVVRDANNRTVCVPRKTR